MMQNIFNKISLHILITALMAFFCIFKTEKEVWCFDVKNKLESISYGRPKSYAKLVLY